MRLLARRMRGQRPARMSAISWPRTPQTQSRVWPGVSKDRLRSLEALAACSRSKKADSNPRFALQRAYALSKRMREPNVTSREMLRAELESDLADAAKPITWLRFY